LGLPVPDPADHTELFIRQLPPYASIYLDPDGKIGGQARDRIAGFWHATGFTPPPEPDHLAALLGLWAALLDPAANGDPARRRLLLHAQHTLVYEHLAPWLIPYLTRVENIAPTPYPAWAQLIIEVIRSALHTDPGLHQPSRHLADPPSLPQGPDDLITYLLAPVRSGIILTHADLNRAAATTNAGIRIGERAYALRSLLEQSPQPVLEWLAIEADRQAVRLGSTQAFSQITNVWKDRARATVAILQTL
jgi:hypothetical protein